jgi:hypothetical protein
VILNMRPSFTLGVTPISFEESGISRRLNLVLHNVRWRRGNKP